MRLRVRFSVADRTPEYARTTHLPAGRIQQLDDQVRQRHAQPSHDGDSRGTVVRCPRARWSRRACCHRRGGDVEEGAEDGGRIGLDLQAQAAITGSNIRAVHPAHPKFITGVWHSLPHMACNALSSRRTLQNPLRANMSIAHLGPTRPCARPAFSGPANDAAR